MKFADPKNDLAFKKIFGDDNKKEILISLLNAILDFKGDNLIESVEILNPYQVPKIPELKETILDIRATNKKKGTFIVEMQKKDLHDFAKRSLYYTSKAYVSQLDKGQQYNKLKKVYFIGLLNFSMFEGDDYISRHLILNTKTLKQEIKGFEFSFIELNKFNLDLKNLNSILEKWLYFINNASDLELIPKEFDDKQEFLEAFEIATQQTWNKKELEVYDYMSMKEYDEINALETATAKGLKKGLEKGLKKGREEGLKEGLEKGTLQRSLDIARNLLDVLDNETIALKTGLNIEQIEKLRKTK
jgi:predicted transposase/invertase (TIGR01784 family)